MPDEYVTRHGVAFVELTADRCYMLPGSHGEHAARFVESYRAMVTAYQNLLADGIHEQVARNVLPSSRPFPRARLGRFPIRHHSEFPDPARDGPRSLTHMHWGSGCVAHGDSP